MTLRVGVVGASYAVGTHLPVYAELPGREIVEKYGSDDIALTGPTYTCTLALPTRSGTLPSLPNNGDRLYIRSDGHRVTQWTTR